MNDAYGFKQQACSSPRLVVWVGTPGDAERASDLFCCELERKLAGRDFGITASDEMLKKWASFAMAMRGQVEARRWHSNALTVMKLKGSSRDETYLRGAGSFGEIEITSLDDLQHLFGPRDQTVAHYGFDPAAVREFARGLNGRGIDRFVPLGQALSFQRFWDGYDLLAEFTKRVFVGCCPMVGPTAVVR